jgi:hypothetical protein
MLTLSRWGLTFECKEHAKEFARLAEEALLRREYSEAEQLCRLGLRMLEPILGPEHLEVGIVTHYLAVALEEQGKVTEAMDLLNRTGRILTCQATSQN